LKELLYLNNFIRPEYDGCQIRECSVNIFPNLGVEPAEVATKRFEARKDVYVLSLFVLGASRRQLLSREIKASLI
jgi:hypothetical protein